MEELEAAKAETIEAFFKMFKEADGKSDIIKRAFATILVEMVIEQVKGATA